MNRCNVKSGPTVTLTTGPTYYQKISREIGQNKILAISVLTLFLSAFLAEAAQAFHSMGHSGASSYRPPAVSQPSNRTPSFSGVNNSNSSSTGGSKMYNTGSSVKMYDSSSSGQKTYKHDSVSGGNKSYTSTKSGTNSYKNGNVNSKAITTTNKTSGTKNGNNVTNNYWSNMTNNAKTNAQKITNDFGTTSSKTKTLTSDFGKQPSNATKGSGIVSDYGKVGKFAKNANSNGSLNSNANKTLLTSTNANPGNRTGLISNYNKTAALVHPVTMSKSVHTRMVDASCQNCTANSVLDLPQGSATVTKGPPGPQDPPGSHREFIQPSNGGPATMLVVDKNGKVIKTNTPPGSTQALVDSALAAQTAAAGNQPNGGQQGGNQGQGNGPSDFLQQIAQALTGGGSGGQNSGDDLSPPDSSPQSMDVDSSSSSTSPGQPRTTRVSSASTSTGETQQSPQTVQAQTPTITKPASTTAATSPIPATCGIGEAENNGRVVAQQIIAQAIGQFSIADVIDENDVQRSQKEMVNLFKYKMGDLSQFCQAQTGDRIAQLEATYAGDAAAMLLENLSVPDDGQPVMYVPLEIMEARRSAQTRDPATGALSIVQEIGLPPQEISAIAEYLKQKVDNPAGKQLTLNYPKDYRIDQHLPMETAKVIRAYAKK